MAEQYAHSSFHLDELNSINKCSSPVESSLEITTSINTGGNDETLINNKNRADTAQLNSQDVVDHATQENIVSSLEDSTDQTRKTLKTYEHHQQWTNKRLSSIPADATVNRLTSTHVDKNLFEAGIKSSEDATLLTFQHHPSTNYAGTDTDMSTANLSLKTRVSQLLYDNEELIQRVNRATKKNQVLTVERERLLTTIQNTSAILQTTFSSISQDRDVEKIRFQLEEGKSHKNNTNRFPDCKSSNSDSLEKSTKSTIREFDNLLSALQGRKTKKNRRAPRKFFRYNDGAKINMSQYDIIVKWLNNKSTWHSDDESSNEALTSSDGADESIHAQEETQQQKQDLSDWFAQIPAESQNRHIVNKKEADEQNSVCSPQELLLPVEGDANHILETSISVEKDELSSKCLGNVQPVTLTAISVSPQKSLDEEITANTSKSNAGSDAPNFDENDEEDKYIEQDLQKIVIPLGGITPKALSESLPESRQPSLHVSVANNEEPPTSSPQKEPVLSVMSENGECLHDWEKVEGHLGTAVVANSEHDKKEFLQDWLEDLRARTQLYNEKSQCGCNSSIAPGNNWDDTDMKTNDDEHEEFITLCKTMMDRMDVMISKSAECQKNDKPSLDRNTSQAGKPYQVDQSNKSNSEKPLKKKKKILSQNIRQICFPHNADSASNIESDPSLSSASSNFSLCDLTKSNVDLENKDKSSLRMFQKCLASLEEMNMRRTNNALTQTLIIKALRKLMTKQFKEESVSNAANDGSTNDHPLQEPNLKSSIDQNEEKG